MLPRPRVAALTGIVLLGTSACADLLGLGSYTNECGGGIDAPNVCKGGGGSSSSSASTGGSGGGSGGEGGCSPNLTEACYDGPGDSWKHGICKRGQHTCRADGSGFGTCDGQVLPKTETCANKSDEDCDGNECAMWAHLFGDADEQTVNGVAVDSQGNVIVVGTFAGTLDFDAQNPITASGTQIYLAKLDSSGAPVWSKVFASQGNVAAAGVAIDSTDAIIATGMMAGGSQINFGMNPLKTTKDGNNVFYDAAWVAKFDAHGKFVWNTEFPDGDTLSGSGFATTTGSAAIDSADAVVITGAGICSLYCADGGLTDMFIRKYNSDSTIAWTKNFSDPDGVPQNAASATTVAVDPFDAILVGGAVRGVINIGGPVDLNANGSLAAFLAKYDSSGAWQWQDSAGTAGSAASITSIATDSAGSSVASGYFSGTVQWKSNPATTSAGGNDIFLVGHDIAGGAPWSVAFGGPGDDVPARVGIAADGDLVFAATTSGAIDFGGGSVAGGGGSDLALVKLDPTRHYRWSRVFGDAADQTAQGLAVLPKGQSVLVAGVAGKIDVGTGLLASAGADDVLVAKFAP